MAARTLELNEVGLCNVATATPVAFDAYAENRETGAFILIDRFTHATAGAGMISFGLRRATNVHRQSLLIDQAAREPLNGHKAVILCITGLSRSGKSTIATLLPREPHGHAEMVIDTRDAAAEDSARGILKELRRRHIVA